MLIPLPAGWPLTALLMGYPVFWALGLSAFAAPIVAVPMAIDLFRRRPIRLPRGFGFWALFLIWTAVGLLVLGVNPPGTIPDSATGRLLGYGTREVSYIALTVILLYVGNLPERYLSQQKIIRMLRFLFVMVTLGGVAALIVPNFNFSSPLEFILPEPMLRSPYVQHLVHPAVAQVQDFSGVTSPRAAAPFPYTNTWAFNITILAVWFVVGALRRKAMRHRVLTVFVLLLASISLLYSLNRAAWLVALFGLALIVIRMALRRRLAPLLGLLLVLTVGLAIFYATPLQQVVSHRLEHGKSNEVRAYSSQRAVSLAIQSPIIGYGSTRNSQGSASTIAVGNSPKCPMCGGVPIGINGYIYMLLMTTGFVGAVLFFGLGLVQVMRARGDPSPIAVGGTFVLFLTLLFAPFYDVSATMTVSFITIALMWRRDIERTRTPSRELADPRNGPQWVTQGTP